MQNRNKLEIKEGKIGQSTIIRTSSFIIESGIKDHNHNPVITNRQKKSI
jgi:hypothetical protein